MPNIKQQAIHPAIDIPHAEGILALAAEPIEKDQLVFPFEQFGAPFAPEMRTHILVRPMTPAPVKLGAGAWWVAKHSAQPGEYVVVLPWAIVPIENGPALGSPVKLDEATGKAVPAWPAGGPPPADFEEGWWVGQTLSETKALVTNNLPIGLFSGRRWYPFKTDYTPGGLSTSVELPFDFSAQGEDILQVCLVRDDSGGTLGNFTSMFTVNAIGESVIRVVWDNPPTNGDAVFIITVSRNTRTP